MSDVIPKHMCEDAESSGHWSPQFYRESYCENCEKPIYRYQMDLIVEWKHFNHATYCSTLRAKPPATEKTAEQQARDMLERMGIEGAQSFSAGELVELANLIADQHEAS